MSASQILHDPIMTLYIDIHRQNPCNNRQIAPSKLKPVPYCPIGSGSTNMGVSVTVAKQLNHSSQTSVHRHVISMTTVLSYLS